MKIGSQGLQNFVSGTRQKLAAVPVHFFPGAGAVGRRAWFSSDLALSSQTRRVRIYRKVTYPGASAIFTSIELANIPRLCAAILHLAESSDGPVTYLNRILDMIILMIIEHANVFAHRFTSRSV